MKNKIQNIVLVVFLIINSSVFAQGPDPDGAGGAVDPTDMMAPIDNNIFILGLMAIVFAYFIYSKKKQFGVVGSFL